MVMRVALGAAAAGLLALCGLAAEALAPFAAGELLYDRDDRDCTLIAEAKEGLAPALQIQVRDRRLRAGAVPVCRTPALPRLAEGTYRATVRLRMQGHLHSIGNGIDLVVQGAAGGGGVVARRTLYPNLFEAEDQPQEFALDFDVSPPLLLRRRFDASDVDAFLASVVGDLHRLAPEDLAFLRRSIVENPGKLVEVPEKAEKRLHDLARRVNAVGNLPEALAVAVSLPENRPGIGGSRGNSSPFPSLRRLFVEAVRVERLAEPAVTVRELAAQYAWRRPGETQRFIVDLHNRSGAEQTAELRLSVLHGLGGRTALPALQVRLADGTHHRERIDWAIPAGHPVWGQGALVEAAVNGEVVSSARTWFTVHPRNNAVLIPFSHGYAALESHLWSHPYAAKPNVANHCEFWAPTPYDSAGLVYEEPDKPFPAGNSCKVESVARQRDQAERLAAGGIVSVFYLEGHGTGRKAWDLYWDNPERVAHVSQYISDIHYQKHVESWNRTAAELAGGQTDVKTDYPHMGFIMFNNLFPDVVDRVIQGHIELMRLVPFTACRWDNATPMRAYGRDVLGKDLGKTEEELIAVSLDNLRRYSREIRAVHPYFEVGFNGGHGELMGRREDPFDFAAARAVIDADPISKLILADQGYILEEAWGHSFENWNDYKIVCRNYLRACRAESAAYKYAGGHHGHMFRDNNVQYTPDDIYQQLFSLLGGAHLTLVNYGPFPGSAYDLGVFAARFSEFFWDPQLRQLERIDEKVELGSDADVWYTEAGFEKVTAQGNRLYVLSLINPPVTEKWLENRYGLLPAPLREPLQVRVKIPEGYRRVAAVTQLQNRPWPEARPLAFEAATGTVTFALPELVTFEVVVLEFAP